MGTVTNIKKAENEIRIQVLELMLEKAKSGELNDLFLVGLYHRDNERMVSEFYHVESDHFFDTSAAIESAMFDRNLRLAVMNGVAEPGPNQ